MELVGPDRVLDHPAQLEEPGREVAVHEPLEAPRPETADGTAAALGPGLDVVRGDGAAVLLELGPDGPVESGLGEAGQVRRRVVQRSERGLDRVLGALGAGGAGRGDELVETPVDLAAGLVGDAFLGQELGVLAEKLAAGGLGRRVAGRNGRRRCGRRSGRPGGRGCRGQDEGRRGQDKSEDVRRRAGVSHRYHLPGSSGRLAAGRAPNDRPTTSRSSECPERRSEPSSQMMTPAESLSLTYWHLSPIELMSS